VTLSRGLRQIRVVLCDDMPELREILREMLAEDRMVAIVGEADNGRDCVRLIAQLQPDVVLLDLSMPDMDGLEAIPQISRVAPRTRIIVVSGFDGNRIGDVALRLGAHRYIEKGAQLQEVSSAVREARETSSEGNAER